MVRTRRKCALPDLGDELTAALTATEELFVALGLAAKYGELPLPAPLAAGVALGAAVRVAWVIAPTQGVRGRVPPGPRLLAPDGRAVDPPLRFVDVDPADLDVLGAAAAVLGRALLPGPGALAAVVADHAAARGTTAVALVVQLARLHGLLDLAWTADVARLHTRVSGAGPQDVALTAAETAAYRRTAERFEAMWRPGIARLPE